MRFRPDRTQGCFRSAFCLSMSMFLFAFAFLPRTSRSANVAEEQERITIGWVAAFSSGDAERMRRFRVDHLGDPDLDGDWRARYLGLVERIGKLRVVGVLVDEPDEVTVVAEDPGSERLQVVVVFDAQNRLKISGVRFEAGEPEPNALPPLTRSQDWTEASRQIDAYIRALADHDAFAGVVLIAEGDTVQFERAYGLANRSFSVPNTIQTRFDVGSITKDVTRVAIAQLVAAGKLTPETKLGDILPDYPNPEAREKITIGHLFSHQSGLPDYFDEDYFSTPMRQLRTNADYIAIWGPKALVFEPGTDRQYSNFGFSVLGAVIEKVTGLSYTDYVAKHVFAAAGMDRSGFFAIDRPVADVAVGYTFMDWQGEKTDTLWTNTFLEPAVGGPWGKSYGPARDLLRFWNALCAGRLVPTPYARWVLLGPLPADGQKVDGDRLIPECRAQGLGGGGPGLSAALQVHGGPVVIVLANLDPPIAEQLAERLVRALP